MIKLLIVEDDASLAYIEKTGLEDIIGGYEVTTASNGKEGLKAWEESKPDVIISDIDMPVMNGFEMVERIRETDGDVIIIFTSALTSPNDVKAGYRLGINNYVKKPFVPEELDAHIQALMKMRGGAKTQKETSQTMPPFATTRQDRHRPSPCARQRFCNCWLRIRIMWLEEKPSSVVSGTLRMTISHHEVSMSSLINSERY